MTTKSQETDKDKGFVKAVARFRNPKSARERELEEALREASGILLFIGSKAKRGRTVTQSYCDKQASRFTQLLTTKEGSRTCDKHGKFPCRECETNHFPGCPCVFCV